MTRRVRSLLWRALAFVVSCYGGSAISETLTVRIASDSLSYFKIKAPSEGTLQVAAESDRPVAMMAAHGYFPTEEHYDVSNFLDWSRSAMSTKLVAPIEQLKASPCDPSKLLERCFGQMSHMRCGTLSGLAASYDKNLEAKPRVCHKSAGSPYEGTCEQQRGPTVQSGAGSSASCLCQKGYCEVSGRCMQADSIHEGCFKVTGHTCPFYSCDAALGPTNCEDGLCVCQPGYCSVNGVCKSGPACQELGSKAMCDAMAVSLEAMQERRLESSVGGASAGDDDCCQVADRARREHPGRFARCAARHFFAQRAAALKGLQVPLLADLSGSGIEDAEDFIIAVRTSAGELEGDAEVRLTVTVERGFDVPLVQPLDLFSTLQELIAPSLIDRMVEMQLLEAPLRGSGASLSQDPLRMRLRAGLPVVLKLGDDPALHEEARAGTLQLRLNSLPKGSMVLYSRTFPEPRSLMDFGHAVKVKQQNGAKQGERDQGVWRAAALNTQYFAVVSATDSQEVEAYFTLHVLPRSEPLALPEPSPTPSVEGGLGVTYIRACASVLLLSTVCAVFGVLWKWRGFLFDGHSSQRYAEVGSRAAIAHAGIDSEDERPARDEEDGGLYANGAFLASLQTLQDNMREKATCRDFGFSSWSHRMMSVSTRAGTSRPSGTCRSSDDEGEDEERTAFLQGEDDDQEAMQSLLKLRPSAHDSLGDDNDDDEMATRPLIGTGRQSALKR